MKTTVVLVLLGISSLTAEAKKTTKRGVLLHSDSFSDGNLDLPPIHNIPTSHNNEYGPLLPLEGEYHSHSAHHESLAPVGHVIDKSKIIGKFVNRHVNIIHKIGIPHPQPYPVKVVKDIPVEVPQEVEVPVDRPYPVPVPVKIKVPVYKDIPVPVVKKVPVPVKIILQKRIPVPYKVYHVKPVPVPIWKKIPVPIPEPVIVKRPVPVFIHTHLKRIPIEEEHIYEEHEEHDHNGGHHKYHSHHPW